MKDYIGEIRFFHEKRNGPEAGQYFFHVALALCMGYKTREEYLGNPQCCGLIPRINA